MSETNFDKTPSYYNSQEVFEKYLGRTSYYRTLQENVIKLCKMANSKNILELGSATGATTFALARAIPEAQVVGVDMRPDIIDVANKLKEQSNLKNVSFINENFCTFDKYGDFDFIVMLYSFHHIEDPDENKIAFLRDVYNTVEKSTFLCIAETFLPTAQEGKDSSLMIKELWEKRVVEGEASTFWESLSGLGCEEIDFASAVGLFCGEYEGIAGNEVVERKTEFLVTESFLCEKAQEIGWKVLINKPCNSVGERIVLLQK